jgi:hypothetical protein
LGSEKFTDTPSIVTLISSLAQSTVAGAAKKIIAPITSKAANLKHFAILYIPTPSHYSKATQARDDIPTKQKSASAARYPFT